MEYTKTVTIASPIRDRELYLPFYLQAILEQTYPKELTNLLFVTNNVTDNSIKILKKFKKLYDEKYSLIRIDDYSNSNIPYDGEIRCVRAKTTKVYSFLAELRNYICQNSNTDHLFSVDSDIMLLPDTLEKLILTNKKCISALVCNGHVFAEQQPHLNIDKYKFTNVLWRNTMGMYTHFRKSQLNNNEILEVDATGAVYLISKDVYKNCKYRLHAQGEDMPFCEDVQKLKEKLYCDTSIKLPHCMTTGLLEAYSRGEFKY